MFARGSSRSRNKLSRGPLLVATSVCLATLPASAFAQDLVLGGRVYDAASTASPVQNARVTLVGHGVTLTNAGGIFVFRGVRRGEYQLRVQALGYQDLRVALTLARDTTLMLPLRADPIELDSLNVALETIDFDGRVRDPRTDSWVADARVRSDQGHHESSNLFGHFDLDDVFDGPPLRLTVLAFGYLPLDTTFIPDDEERYPFDLAPDPLMSRMIDHYVEGLDERAGEDIYEFQPALNREDLARFPTNLSLLRILERRYPLRVVRSIGCLFLDEREYFFRGEEERRSVLEGTFANDLARIELFEFQGYGSLYMVRAYTRHFFQRHVGGRDELDDPMMIATPGGIVCR